MNLKELQEAVEATVKELKGIRLTYPRGRRRASLC
jgi:hypothetical protein